MNWGEGMQIQSGAQVHLPFKYKANTLLYFFLSF